MWPRSVFVDFIFSPARGGMAVVCTVTAKARDGHEARQISLEMLLSYPVLRISYPCVEMLFPSPARRAPFNPALRRNHLGLLRVALKSIGEAAMSMPTPRVDIREEVDAIGFDPAFYERQRSRYASRGVALVVLLNGLAAIAALVILERSGHGNRTFIATFSFPRMETTMPELIRAEGAGFITGCLMAFLAVGAIWLLTISL